ncbi:glycosyltransferase family 2 protein [Legionella lytica]|uniref:Glycosyltransferase family 2 protein n=1 Tax=Legionella lytica TaxID=96232 RepID=A0ABY4Y4G2_9GAMM|nr:glycosyltransferase [Legionella lytica]USQ12525.1 glycosyltransferase family 2 protein [Legionella lytica]
MVGLINFLSFLALLGVIPVITLFLQFLLVGLHGLKNHYSQCKNYTPRVAIIIPVWNEEDVIGFSIDSLMSMNYPYECLRVYAIDDVSTDNTPQILAAKSQEYPDHVFNVRRTEKIDFGKAAVVNHGLRTILNDSWAEAIMIIDADVMFEKNTLLRMTRHFADPHISAVTAYIKEGQNPGNFISRSIGFEYIVAQAATRRAQNVLGVMACLAGGAQLHTRANIEQLGGKVDTSTLVEDTYTTFKTQLHGNKVLFDGNAIAIAEEPGDISSLWRQRFRWAEGNVQIIRKFKKIWFRPNTPGGLGGIFFGLIWFSTVLMPLIMITTSLALNTLYFLNTSLSWQFFRIFSLISFAAYLFTTFYSFCIDPKTAKRVWFEGIMFPGLISLINMLVAVFPDHATLLIHHYGSIELIYIYDHYFLLWANTWIALCMFCAWVVYHLDRAGVPQIITSPLLLLVGYGPLLCVITLSAYLVQFFHREMKWNKTIKTCKVEVKKNTPPMAYNFQKILVTDQKAERRLFYYEVLMLMILIIFCVLHRYYGLS